MNDGPISLEEAQHRAERGQPPAADAVNDAEAVTEPPEDAIKRLAKLPTLEYEKQRDQVAKDIGIRVGALDRLVRAEQRKSEDAAGFSLREVEPWPESVDGDALLDSIAQAVRRYLVLPPNGAEVIALWVIAAHAFNGFQISPRLHIRSPEKRCGKTIALDVLECLTPRSIRTENITTAVLFRLVDDYQPTQLIDEVDSFLNDNDELRGA